MQRPSGPVFVEVFAGEAGLSQAVSARGMQILPPIEIVINNFVKEKVDILDPAVFQHLQFLIQEGIGIVIFIHFATPCSSFSIARKHDGGPPPLRDRQHLWGRHDLSRRDREKLLLAACWATSSWHSLRLWQPCATIEAFCGRSKTRHRRFYGACPQCKPWPLCQESSSSCLTCAVLVLRTRSPLLFCHRRIFHRWLWSATWPCGPMCMSPWWALC